VSQFFTLKLYKILICFFLLVINQLLDNILKGNDADVPKFWVFVLLGLLNHSDNCHVRLPLFEEAEERLKLCLMINLNDVPDKHALKLPNGYFPLVRID